MGSLIKILVLQALEQQARGDDSRALAALERALALAEPEGYLRVFVAEGEPMRLMIAEFRLMIEKQSAHPLLCYVDRILKFFSRPLTTPQSAISTLQSENVEPLSDRELEVLRLLRSELSGPEIARQLIISLNTFRTHTKNIYQKLNVNNRRAAVRHAEELDLL